jgi:hypothetical protein
MILSIFQRFSIVCSYHIFKSVFMFLSPMPSIDLAFCSLQTPDYSQLYSTTEDINVYHFHYWYEHLMTQYWTNQFQVDFHRKKQIVCGLQKKLSHCKPGVEVKSHPNSCIIRRKPEEQKELSKCFPLLKCSKEF